MTGGPSTGHQSSGRPRGPRACPRDSSEAATERWPCPWLWPEGRPECSGVPGSLRTFWRSSSSAQPSVAQTASSVRVCWSEARVQDWPAGVCRLRSRVFPIGLWGLPALVPPLTAPLSTEESPTTEPQRTAARGGGETVPGAPLPSPHCPPVASTSPASLGRTKSGDRGQREGHGRGGGDPVRNRRLRHASPRQGGPAIPLRHL